MGTRRQIVRNKEFLEKSFLPEFEHILNTFLMQEKGQVLLLSVTNNLLRLLAQARFRLELEMKSFSTPLEELKDKIKIFENKKKKFWLKKTTSTSCWIAPRKIL